MWISAELGQSSFRDASVRLLELPLLLFAYFLALSAATLRVGVYFSISFSTASWCILGCLLMAIAALAPNAISIWREKRGRSFNFVFLGIVFCTAAISGLMAASVNRPDIDDSIYASKALFYLANPLSPLDRTITWIADLPAPIYALDLQYYETTEGAVAWLLGVHYLDVYHVLFPAIAGFLMCLSLLLFLHVFDHRKWACVGGVAFLLLVFMALGETHMAFGNLSLARAFHAKYVFLSVLVPFWSYLSLQFFTSRSWKSWLGLFAIGAGIVGATSTAMVFLPLLSFLLAATFILTSSRPLDAKHIRTMAIYGAALVPVLAGALQFFIVARDRVASGTAISAGYPVDFYKQLNFLINTDAPLTPVLFVVSAVAVLWFSPYRRFFAVWGGLCIVLFLNPLVSRYVMTYIAPETIYWRLFYLLPFPAIVGLSFMLLLRNSYSSRSVAVMLGVLMAYAGFFGPTSILRAKNGSKLAWPGYKIDSETLSVISDIVATTPHATMFAPHEISSNMLIYSAAFPQYHMRGDYLEFVLVPGYQAEFAERTGAFRYLYQNDASARPAFESMISRALAPQLIVLDTTAQRPEVRSLLEKNRYSVKAGNFSKYVLYERL